MPPKRGRPSNAQREAERSAAVSKGKAAASTSAAAQEPANTPNGSITVSVGGPSATTESRSPETAKTASMNAPRASASASKKGKDQAQTAANATAEEPNASSTPNAADATTNGTTPITTTSTTNTKESKLSGNGTPKKNTETALVVASDGNSDMNSKNSKNNDITALARGGAYTAASRVIGTGYENINNIEEIQLRQFHEDIDAYQHDLAFCTATLAMPDLTPQEARSFQLRQLDLGHQIRHCQHKIENLQVQLRRQGIPFTNYSASSGGRAYTASLLAGAGVAGVKRSDPSDDDDDGGKTTGSAKKAKLTPDEPQLLDADGDEVMTTGAGRERETGSPNGNSSSPQPLPYGTPGTWEYNIPLHPSHPSYQHQHQQNGNGANNSPPYDEENQQNTALQRLGYWKCRLCSAPKYLLAGTGRSPAAPCKWPLKDISKMITHFTEMHTEHSPAERCSELGYALAKNRGPFEYWLRRTRAQNVGDGEIIDEIIQGLINGVMPHQLRRLSRAASGMPA